MYLIWHFKQTTEVRAVIVDKTVYDKKAQEHNGITWLLKNEKYVDAQGNFYDKNQSYYGFFPITVDSFQIKDFQDWSKDELDSLAENLDFLYYADSYGVYENEWSKKKKINERSKLIYGGTSKKEVDLLELAHKKNKKIITEFNLIASPTRSRERKRIEKLFDFQWSGWVGRYYDVLDSNINADLPYWLKKSYVEQHQEWNFKNSGIIFVHRGGRIEILDAPSDLNDENMYILTNSFNQNEYDLPEELKYNFWFDILSYNGENEVVSTYQIMSNDRGDSLLSSWGLKNSFPALIRSKDKSFTYMCGDFADNDPGSYSAYFSGSHFFKPMFTDKTDKSAREYFYWDYFRPLVVNILKELDNEKESTK